MGNFCSCKHSEETTTHSQVEVYTLGTQPQVYDRPLEQPIDETSFSDVKQSYEAMPPQLPLPDSVLSITAMPKEEFWQDAGLDVVLFEGSVLKFKPGLSQLYVSRWLQLTTHELRYYKNQLAANCWLTKPLYSVPLLAVRDVAR
jgi:hypothetical protein